MIEIYVFPFGEWTLYVVQISETAALVIGISRCGHIAYHVH